MRGVGSLRVVVWPAAAWHGALFYQRRRGVAHWFGSGGMAWRVVGQMAWRVGLPAAAWRGA